MKKAGQVIAKVVHDRDRLHVEAIAFARRNGSWGISAAAVIHGGKRVSFRLFLPEGADYVHSIGFSQRGPRSPDRQVLDRLPRERGPPRSAKALAVATIVGQKTRGNVLGAANFRVGSGYWLRLPVFGWFTSKGRTLEANGVEPDVSVEISPDALAEGQDNQLSKAIEIVSGL